LVEALRGEADPREALRRTPAEAPEPARLAGRRVADLTGLRMPHARPGMAAPNLEHMRMAGEKRRHPVEAVTAEIHQASAAREPLLERIEHRLGPVLGVAPGQQDAIAEEKRAFLMVQ